MKFYVKTQIFYKGHWKIAIRQSIWTSFGAASGLWDLSKWLHLALRPGALQWQEGLGPKRTSEGLTFSVGAVQDCLSSHLDFQSEHTGSAPLQKWLPAVKMTPSGLRTLAGSICSLLTALFWVATGVLQWILSDRSWRLIMIMTKFLGMGATA